ncbi:hypothetical protein IAD21_05360 [Abditibacteriota bacterium]|nr:hypothetical protein IAD21_05360 [Abditibacteriota bacterium]
MTGNIYLDLTNEFNEGQLRAILSSGQAVVMHRLALSSKDGDWIVRETSESLDFILRVLDAHGARYRLGAPLDVRWMSGGWSAHFEFALDGYRARCDFVTRPPRLSREDLASLWDEQEHGENGGLEVPTIDLRRLADLKKTDRERDYAVIGDLARKMSVEDQLLQSRSARDLIDLAKQYPQLVQKLAFQRPLLLLLDQIGESRIHLQRALAEEQFDLMERNEKRLAAYSRASNDWSSNWPQIQKQLRQLPLIQAHELLVASARRLLPMEVESV